VLASLLFPWNHSLRRYEGAPHGDKGPFLRPPTLAGSGSLMTVPIVECEGRSSIQCRSISSRLRCLPEALISRSLQEQAILLKSKSVNDLTLRCWRGGHDLYLIQEEA
jgi:hypothetical protein